MTKKPKRYTSVVRMVNDISEDRWFKLRFMIHIFIKRLKRIFTGGGKPWE